MARNTVRAALRVEGPPRYERPATGSIVDAVEPAELGLVREFPAMPATVIAERIGWTRLDFECCVIGSLSFAPTVPAAGSVPAHDLFPG